MIEATRNQLPSHLYEARDQARLCLGDAFDMQMFEGGVLLTRIAADRRETVLSVAIRMARRSYCLLYTSPSPRDGLLSRMPSSA